MTAKRIPAVVALVVLIGGAELTGSGAQAACGKACQLIQQGYKRDQKRCRKKWKDILEQCKKAADPNPSNNCGVPIITTSTVTTTSATTSSAAPFCPAPSSTVSTVTTSTTFPPCTVDGDRCGPTDRVCRCTHLCEGDDECDDTKTPPEPLTPLVCVDRANQLQSHCMTNDD